MADRVTRLCHTNVLRGSGVLPWSSSEDSAATIQAMLDPQPTRYWRSSEDQFTTLRGINDALDFVDSAGVKRVAFVQQSSRDAVEFAAAVEAAMQAAGVSPDNFGASLWAWYRADKISGVAEGGAVAQWDDQSGNARHLAQGTSAKRPTFRLAGYGSGRPAVSFDGVDDALDVAVAIPSPCTVFVVYRAETPTSGTGPIMSSHDTVVGAANNASLYVTTTPTLVARTGTGGGPSRTTTLNAWHLGVFNTNATNVRVANDDLDTAALGSDAVAAYAGNLRVGNDSGGTNYYKGMIAEIVVLSSDATEEERRRVAKYLVRKYWGGWADNTTNHALTTNLFVTYDATTQKFTINLVSGSPQILWSTGKHASATIGKALGFVVSADDTGAQTYTGDSAVVRAMEFLAFDLGSAQQVEVAALYAHNLGSGGTVTLHGSSGRDVVSNPAFTQVLGGDDLARIRVAFLSAPQTYRYWAFVIDAGGAALAEPSLRVGYAFAGSYEQLARSYRRGMTQRPVMLGKVLTTVEGGMFRSAHRMPLELSVEWGMLPRSDFDAFLSVLRATQDDHVFLALDPLNFPGTRTYYGVIAGVAPVPEMVGDGDPPDRYTIRVEFAEAPAS